MPRIRTVKPEFFQHEDLSSVDIHSHFLAMALLCYADDEGYFNANPGLIKGMILPLRGEAKPISQCINELAKIGYLRLGTGKDGKRYGHIVHFLDHQVVSHGKQSKIKNLGIVWESSGKLLEPSSTPPVRVHPEVELKGSGIEGEGEGENQPPEGLPPLAYARGVLERINLPITPKTCEVVAAAIEARSRGSGQSLPAAVEFLIARALDAKDGGETVNKFWFEDGKYESTNGKKKSGLTY